LISEGRPGKLRGVRAFRALDIHTRNYHVYFSATLAEFGEKGLSDWPLKVAALLT